MVCPRIQQIDQWLDIGADFLRLSYMHQKTNKMRSQRAILPQVRESWAGVSRIQNGIPQVESRHREQGQVGG
jgi:hypothetical protein